MTSAIIIARAFGGQPLKREVVSISKGLVYITNREALSDFEGVGFPERDVFCFDKTAFSELCAQWESGQKTKSETWATLRRYR